MGLLTDPNPGQGKFAKMLLNMQNRLCALLYIAGLVWFLCLAYKDFNNATYFSENALLPGLVRGEFGEDVLAKNLHEELRRVMESNPGSIPYSWLRAKFSQMHLDSYLHNYTVSFPLGAGSRFYGQNVYAVLRAPRASSLEGLVLSAPFRTLDSPLPDNTAGIALLLAVAKFCRRHKYWAKDIVFLITDNEQLGAQAWLEAYHGVQVGGGVLDAGHIEARAGAIQAAINLELHSFKLSHIDVKVEGLNGQLPNLDLANLVHRLCGKEGIRHTFKNRTNPRKKDSPYEQWEHSLVTLLHMIFTQASCVPNGNHGLYHRFGIEALTLEGYEIPSTSKQQVGGVYQAGRVLEGTLRSLNNLLERFHQSYFFYLLPSNDRFISIGLYMPVVGLLGYPLLLQALTIWLRVHSEIKSGTLDARRGTLRTTVIGSIWLICHALGLLLVRGSVAISQFAFKIFEMSAPTSVYITQLLTFNLSLLGPALVHLGKSETDALTTIALLETATVLLTVAMHNFALAFLLAAVMVPVLLCVSPSNSSVRRILQSVALLFIHPFILLHLTVVIYTSIHLDLPFGLSLVRESWSATQASLVFFITDNLIYGNWFQDAVFGFLVPCWLMFWILSHSSAENSKTKTD